MFSFMPTLMYAALVIVKLQSKTKNPAGIRAHKIETDYIDSDVSILNSVISLKHADMNINFTDNTVLFFW